MKENFKLISSFSVKAQEEDSDVLKIEGYANTTEKDRMGDIVLKEAWEKGALQNFENNPIVLAFHDHSRPIGKVVGHKVTAKGLKITAEISKSAGEISGLIKEGILSTFSIGFSIKDADYDAKKDTFFIKDLELLEVSVVSVPANAGSTFSVRKSFESSEDYETFKEQYKPEEVEEQKEVSKTAPSDVDTKALEDKIESLTTHTKALEEKVTELTESTKAIEPAPPVEEEAKEEKNMTTEVTKEGLDALLETINARFEKYEASEESKAAAKDGEIGDLLKQIEDLRGDLTEKSEEIDNFRKSKMRFEDKGDQISVEDKINAALLAKCLNVKTGETKMGRDLIQKSGGEHLPATYVNPDSNEFVWEEALSTSLLADYRNRLVVADAMSGGGTRMITMPTPVFRMPVNPEAGTGYWIPGGHLRSTQGPLSGSPSSTGAEVIHDITDITLTAYKLAAKEYIGYEEEEDSLIPLLPIIREAIARRMARSWDIALLRGAGSPGSTLALNDPIQGLVTFAGSPLLGSPTQNVASISKMTVATLQTLRRGLGTRGLDPNDIIYIVSNDAYFDLLEDPDFRTPDVIGDSRATILKGTIGMVNGSQVIASGEFATQATNVCGALAVYRPNFMIGELRGMMLERDKSIEDQVNMLIATRRAAFGQIIANQGVTGGFWA